MTISASYSEIQDFSRSMQIYWWEEGEGILCPLHSCSGHEDHHIAQEYMLYDPQTLLGHTAVLWYSLSFQTLLSQPQVVKMRGNVLQRK